MAVPKASPRPDRGNKGLGGPRYERDVTTGLQLSLLQGRRRQDDASAQLAGRLSESVGADRLMSASLTSTFSDRRSYGMTRGGPCGAPIAVRSSCGESIRFHCVLEGGQLSVVTLTRGGDNDPDPKRGEFSLAYFGVDMKAVQDLAPSSLNEWQCEYIATRVVELIHHAFRGNRDCRWRRQ